MGFEPLALRLPYVCKKDKLLNKAFCLEVFPITKWPFFVNKTCYKTKCAATHNFTVITTIDKLYMMLIQMLEYFCQLPLMDSNSNLTPKSYCLHCVLAARTSQGKRGAKISNLTPQSTSTWIMIRMQWQKKR